MKRSTGAASILAISIATVSVGTPRETRAAGFAAARFGGEHGNVVTTNPTALYFNPAGIAFSEGTHIFVDGTLALRSASWEHPRSPNDPPDPMGAEGQSTGKATLFNVFGGPMLGATTKLGNLAFGASLSVPFGGRASWDKNEAFPRSGGDPSTQFPLAVDGIQRWHGIDGALTFIYLTAGAAYRIGPLAIGATGNLVLSSIKSLQAKGFAGTGRPEPNNEGRAEIDVSGTHGSFGLGAMLEALPNRLWVGASYQAQPGLGPQVLSGTLTNVYLGSNAPFPVKFNQALPDIVRLGARFRPSETLELRAFGDFTRWSVLKTQCVVLANKDYPCAVNPNGSDASGSGAVLQNLRRRWNDTFGIRGGVSHWLKPTVELFAGLGYETAAVPDETLDPSIGDANNLSAALGARFGIIPAVFVAGSYTHIQFLNRDNIGKSELALPSFPTARADGGGKYTQWIGLFNVNVEAKF
ncbi:MAG TPA: outer membrane protein transport protein [Polyangiaceae bacterium]|nr:outer membrane protein transport protein [Polyangiaceae bacterium]